MLFLTNYSIRNLVCIVFWHVYEGIERINFSSSFGWELGGIGNGDSLEPIAYIDNLLETKECC